MTSDEIFAGLCKGLGVNRFPNWDDSWLYYTRQITPIIPRLRCLRGEEWELAESMLHRGVTLGLIVSNVDQAVSATAVIASRIPVHASYSERDNVLFVRLNQGMLKVRNGKDAGRAKPVARRKAKG